jgi:hypothetical protein
MDRKISKFAVNDEITTRQSVRDWATGKKNLNIYRVHSVTEDSRGITYRTTACNDVHEELVIDPKDAKPMALKFLAECMIKISTSEASQ